MLTGFVSRYKLVKWFSRAPIARALCRPRAATERPVTVLAASTRAARPVLRLNSLTQGSTHYGCSKEVWVRPFWFGCCLPACRAPALSPACEPARLLARSLARSLTLPARWPAGLLGLCVHTTILDAGKTGCPVADEGSAGAAVADAGLGLADEGRAVLAGAHRTASTGTPAVLTDALSAVSFACSLY